jgi:hypothetical protein
VIDLANPIDRYKLVKLIEADVDAYCIAHFKSEHRNHLGASEIGHPCAAKAWGKFRWLKLEQHSGRMRRLFERGHLEESRFVAILRGIGFEVHEVDSEGNQFRISGSQGHFGGSLDGISKAPARYEIPDDIILPDEFKTHSEKSFTKLAGSKDKATGERKFVTGTHGVRISKPVHFSQMSSYARAYGYRYALYVAVNKDTDELYFEIVVTDWSHADDLFRKADSVIFSQEQPPKIAQVETFFECKYCHLSRICFHGEMPEKNCRSCSFAVPIEGGQWHCENVCANGLDAQIPADLIKTGCDEWRAIINGA